MSTQVMRSRLFGDTLTVLRSALRASARRLLLPFRCGTAWVLIATTHWPVVAPEPTPPRPEEPSAMVEVWPQLPPDFLNPWLQGGSQ